MVFRIWWFFLHKPAIRDQFSVYISSGKISLTFFRLFFFLRNLETRKEYEEPDPPPENNLRRTSPLCTKSSSLNMGDSVLKSGAMIKRSQNKKKWSIVNYKNRWFEISRSFLIYYDNCEGGREVSLLFPLFMISFISTLGNWSGESFSGMTNARLCLSIIDMPTFRRSFLRWFNFLHSLFYCCHSTTVIIV